MAPGHQATCCYAHLPGRNKDLYWHQEINNSNDLLPPRPYDNYYTPCRWDPFINRWIPVVPLIPTIPPPPPTPDPVVSKRTYAGKQISFLLRKIRYDVVKRLLNPDIIEYSEEDKRIIQKFVDTFYKDTKDMGSFGIDITKIINDNFRELLQHDSEEYRADLKDLKEALEDFEKNPRTISFDYLIYKTTRLERVHKRIWKARNRRRSRR